jgi:Vitamin K-dependent gamma-carboxylase
VTQAQQSPSWNPLKCTGTDLPVNLTIMVKVLAIVLLVTNHVRILPDPWLPFIPWLDLFPPVPFQRTLQTVFVISALAIVFNRKIRISSLILGSTMLLAVVSSKAYYGNNKTFCGLMLFLAGLYKPGGPPFIRWQLAITYFGAGLNKALDGDWHTGLFFENWAVHRLHQPFYIALDSMLPPMWLARFMCWTTIVTEVATVPCILIPQLNYWAVLANIFFQSNLLLFTGTTFTLFFYSMTAASLAFVDWPDSPVPVLYDPASRPAAWARRLFQGLDVDGRFAWNPAQAGLQLVVGKKVYRGFRALRMLVLLNPITYFVIAASIAALGDVPGPAALYRRLIVGTALVLLMPPLAWLADMCFGENITHSTPIAGTIEPIT